MTKKSPIGIIGGSGLYAMESFQLTKEHEVSTPYGAPSDHYFEGKLGGVDVIFLPRHGRGHLLSPSELNFRANIWGFKKLGVEAIYSVSAVGSLKEEIVPGHMVIVDQFIDRTKARASTYFEQGLVAHVSFAEPLCTHLRNELVTATKEVSVPVHEGGTYVCMEGPQFSTKAESHMYRSWGASVIGMTNLQEAKLAREAEICYATLALSTDYDCWREEEEAVTTEQVIAILHQNVENAQKILLSAVKAHQDRPECSCRSSLKNAILSQRDCISSEAKERLRLLVGKYLG